MGFFFSVTIVVSFSLWSLIIISIFKLLHSILWKQIYSILPQFWKVIDHKRCHNVAKKISDTGSFVSWVISRFYHIFTSSLIYYYRTDARYHGIYLLNRYRDVFPTMILSVICPITDLCNYWRKLRFHRSNS